MRFFGKILKILDFYKNISHFNRFYNKIRREFFKKYLLILLGNLLKWKIHPVHKISCEFPSKNYDIEMLEINLKVQKDQIISHESSIYINQRVMYELQYKSNCYSANELCFHGNSYWQSNGQHRLRNKAFVKISITLTQQNYVFSRMQLTP